MARIVLDQVTKVFGRDVVAVDGVSFDIDDGECMVLVGPSGCGKSTILRLVAGLEQVTAGEIWIGDRLVTDLLPRDRDVAMVFQNYAIYPHMTVAQNIGFGLKIRGVRKAEASRKVEEVARILGLQDLQDRKPAELSGGQRQRVAMGRAMIREPEALLLLPQGFDLRGAGSSRLVLGIRPSDIRSADAAGAAGLPMVEVMVEMVEDLGSELNVMFRVEAPRFSSSETIA